MCCCACAAVPVLLLALHGKSTPTPDAPSLAVWVSFLGDWIPLGRGGFVGFVGIVCSRSGFLARRVDLIRAVGLKLVIVVCGGARNRIWEDFLLWGFVGCLAGMVSW